MMFFSYSSEIVKAAELLVPGHGVELVRVLDTVAFAGFVLGLVVGMVVMCWLRLLFSNVITSRRYFVWQKARRPVNHAD